MSGATASNSKGRKKYKLVILGDGGVGKSALVIQFVCHRFQEYHDPTIEDAYEHQCKLDGEAAHLDILDTAGQVSGASGPEFTAMREQYMRNGQGFVICYSITDRRSFDEVLAYKKLIDRVRVQDIPIVIAANKCDLEERRKISAEDGAALARSLGCPFYETSAVLRQCVDDVFHGLVREIRRAERDASNASEKQNQKRNKLKRLQAFFGNMFKRTHNH